MSYCTSSRRDARPLQYNATMEPEVGALIFNRHTKSGGVVGDDNSGNGGGGSAASARVSADNEASSAIGNAVRRRGLKRRRLL